MNNPPAKLKILFIAIGNGSHTHSWINLIQEKDFDRRLFCVDDGIVPDNIKPLSYSLTQTFPFLHPKRKGIFRGKSTLMRGISFLLKKDTNWLEGRWLAKIVRKWQPDIIHTLGLYPASFFYYSVREKYNLAKYGVWIVTARGGPELLLKRLIPEEAARIRKVLETCNQFIADNQQNYNYALELGLVPSKMSALGIVPGTGGVNVDVLSEKGKIAPSKRKRIILWPKAYECPASKALPIFEALRICWERIKPCEIYMTAMIPETQMWFNTLPSQIKSSCYTSERIPQTKLMELMTQARVMLAPSLTDGIPNTLYEAMASGAFPILSPLETVTDVVHNGQHVLFARNLYPQEISDALVTAMSDDKLVDTAAAKNRELVRKIANRNLIATKIANYYRNIGHKNRGL